jgi:hypothetical protein
MRRIQFFAAGLSVALLLGAGSPAAAKPTKGQAKGHDKPAKTAPVKDPKSPKSKPGVNGGGVSFAGAKFSVQARAGRPAKGHFNYTSATRKIRCKNATFSPVTYIQPGPPGAGVTAECFQMGPGRTRTPISLDATFFDHGKTGDQAHITFTRNGEMVLSDSGTIRRGDIHIRS